jgi:hypothetical protein
MQSKAEDEWVDQTMLIRQCRHSARIWQEVLAIEAIRQNSDNEDNEGVDEARCQEVASFLYTYYTDLFHKVVQGDVDLTLFRRFIDVLQRIEQGELSQHDASVHVGKVLKELYVDSALRRGERLDKLHEQRAPPPVLVDPPEPVSYRDFKRLGTNEWIKKK